MFEVVIIQRGMASMRSWGKPDNAGLGKDPRCRQLSGQPGLIQSAGQQTHQTP